MSRKDHYTTLGVARDASQADIKSAYRRLARKYHPDVSKHPDAEARFKAVGEAYEVLKDPERRAAYDQFGDGWQGAQAGPGAEGFRPPPGWESAFRGGAGPGHASFNMGDIFEGLFGGTPRERAGTRERPRPEPTSVKLSISLEDAYSGTERRLRLSDGPGSRGTRTLKVRIPPGVVDGQRIRLPGQGAPGLGGPGDLFLEVELLPHARFRVEGRDVFLDLPVTPWEAALGAEVRVPTLAGPVGLRIPPGSQSDRRLRLKGRGLGGDKRGDQYVVIKIHTPPADSDAGRAFYERMAREMPFDPRTSGGSGG